MSELGKHKPSLWRQVADLFKEGIEKGTYTVLPFRMYRSVHAAQALRLMATGKHMGKVLLLMKDPDVKADRKIRRNKGNLSDRTVFVFGGTSGIGMEVCRYYVRFRVGRLIICGRSEKDDPGPAAAIAELRSMGAERVIYERCDVTAYEDVRRVIDTHYAVEPRRCEIYFAVGVYVDEPLRNVSYKSFFQVLAPKVLGAVNLQRVLAGRDPDVFCLLSSATSVFGNAGQCSYAVANAFLDGLASKRASVGLSATSVNFGPFSDVGYLSTRADVRRMIEKSGMMLIPSGYGVKALENATTMRIPRVGFFDFDWHRFLIHANTKVVPPYLRYLVDQSAVASDEAISGIPILEALRNASAADRVEIMEDYVVQAAAKILSTSPKNINRREDLSNQGLDSLSTVELAMSIQRDIGVNINPDDLATAREPRSIAAVLVDYYDQSAVDQ